MASIRKAANGQGWLVEVRRRKPYPFYKSATFPKKTQAQMWAAQVEAEYATSKITGVPDITFGDVLQRYKATVSINKRSGDKEVVRIDRLLKEPFATIKVKDLTEAHFAEWRDRLLSGTPTRRPICGESVLRYMHILNPAINTAIKEWKWMTTNPLVNINKPKRSIPRARRPTHEELSTLCFVMKYERDKPTDTATKRVAAAMLFSIETGCRAKDLCSIRKDTVNFKLRTARVGQDTKTGARDIALTTEACRIAKQVMESHDAPTVFDLNPSQIDALFRKYKKQAGVEGLTFHDMKHEACTRLAKYMKIEALARNVGTTNLSTLMIYYNPTAAELASNLP